MPKRGTTMVLTRSIWNKVNVCAVAWYLFILWNNFLEFRKLYGHYGKIRQFERQSRSRKEPNTLYLKADIHGLKSERFFQFQIPFQDSRLAQQNQRSFYYLQWYSTVQNSKFGYRFGIKTKSVWSVFGNFEREFRIGEANLELGWELPSYVAIFRLVLRCWEIGVPWGSATRVDDRDADISLLS